MRELHGLWIAAPLSVSILLTLFASALDAAQSSGAPIWPGAPTCRIASVPKPPRLDGGEPFSDPLWRQAEPIDVFFSKGAPEDAARGTEVRLVTCGGVLYVGARMAEANPETIVAGREGVLPTKDDEEPVVDDSLELYFAQSDRPEFPYVRIRLSAGGLASVTRFIRPHSRWKKYIPSEELDPAPIEMRAGVGEAGWWLTAAIPLSEFSIPPSTIHANIVRHRKSDATRYAWIDLRGVALHFPYYFGRMEVVDDPVEVPPRLALPAALAVGVNNLRLERWREGYGLAVDGGAVPVDADGNARVRIGRRGLALIEIVDSDGAAVAGYSCEVKRPLVIDAAEPFGADLTKPLRVSVNLNVATGASFPVTLEARQGPERLARETFQLAPGAHEVELACQGAEAGEIALRAEAELPGLAGAVIGLSARHWCMRGADADELDRFRAGIEKLDTRELYRAALADAGNYFRLIQAGDGRYPMLDGVGGRRFSEWYYGFVYAIALLYRTDWPENPYRGDERFLASAVAGMEAGLDPAAEYPAGGYDRHLQAYLLTYDLLSDDIEPETAEYWRRRLVEITQHTIDSYVLGGTYLYRFFSDYVGTSTNHYAYYVSNVYVAGGVLNRPDWLEMGKDLMLGIAAHEDDGHFAERRGVPVPHYGRLTMNALGQYYFHSGDQSVRENLERAAEFCCHTSLGDQDVLLLHEGRTNSYPPFEFGEFVLSLTPHGRFLARRLALRHIGPERRPGRSSPEYWFRTAENALYFQPGEAEDLPEETEFPFLDGRGLIVRRKGFICALSAICVPPTKRLYWLDPQNTIELHHAGIGPILYGANSIMQPEAGSFFRKVGERTIFLPKDGMVEKTDGGHFAHLDFDTFSVRLTCRVLSERIVEIKVDLVSAEGDEPVVFNFFPATAADDEPAVSDGGRILAFSGVRLESNRPVEIERGFLIASPYSLERTVRTKPVRVHVNLEEKHPLLLRIELTREAQ